MRLQCRDDGGELWAICTTTRTLAVFERDDSQDGVLVYHLIVPQMKNESDAAYKERMKEEQMALVDAMSRRATNGWLVIPFRSPISA